MLEWLPRRRLPAPDDSWLGGCLHLSASDGEYAGDLEILQSLVPMAGLTGGIAFVPGAPLAFLVSVLSPRLGGRLRTLSADAAPPPRIDYGYPETDEGWRLLREVARATAELVATDAFEEVSGGLVGPGPELLANYGLLDRWTVARHLAPHLRHGSHGTGR
ncbi:hypothetical protein [Streptomyces sp. 3213.3]|uniref:hypothetical protein n=1 Tax=Streptomyces sp. 3213.3 TaxID=1855348 RepID=UPI000AEC96B2|nr:hypothetical protein [Streptomyces sp. 3213.3]